MSVWVVQQGYIIDEDKDVLYGGPILVPLHLMLFIPYQGNGKQHVYQYPSKGAEECYYYWQTMATTIEGKDQLTIGVSNGYKFTNLFHWQGALELVGLGNMLPTPEFSKGVLEAFYLSED